MDLKHITNAATEDIDAITKLYIESVHKHFKGTLPDEELAMWIYKNEKKRFTKQLADKITIIRVIRANNNELVGFTRFGADPDNANNGCLESIFIKVDWGRVFLDTELGLRIDPQEIVHDQIRNSRNHAQAILGTA